MRKSGDRTLGYTVSCEYVVQPVSHRGGSGSFRQRVKLLMPDRPAENLKVLYIMGHEQSIEDSWLVKLFRYYGSRQDMALLCAEHRGYGKSIAGEDQSLPEYVSIPEALADFHEVRRAYSGRFPGDWIVCGFSYGGALAIDYAHRYPGDARLAVSSSGVVDWNAMLPEYDAAVRENLGAALYGRLCRRVDALSPAAPFDENWYGREIICAFVTGIAQYENNQRLRPVIDALSLLPAHSFVRLLGWLDVRFSGSAAKNYAEANRKPALSNSEAESCRYSWRVWRYQQASALGTFWAPAEKESIYRRCADDWTEECRLLFGRDPRVFSAGTQWEVRRLIPELKIPLVYIRGGRDPWRGVGLEPDYPLRNGLIINFEDGFHCPDRCEKRGAQVMERIFAML